MQTSTVQRTHSEVPVILTLGSAKKARKGVKKYLQPVDLMVSFKHTGKELDENQPAGEYWIPLQWTVTRNVHNIFMHMHERIGKMLQQDFNGKLSFATDCWILPNHKAMVAFSVHFEQNGIPARLVLDVVELAKAHLVINLAVVFAKMLKEFGIDTRILAVTADNTSTNDVMIDELDILNDLFQCQTLLHQFDATPAKKQKNTHDVALDAAEQALQDLTGDLEDFNDDNDMGKWDMDTVDLEDIEGWADKRDNIRLRSLRQLCTLLSSFLPNSASLPIV
ncbi:hypothetical protein EVJ58_g5590 [Rhodofomes roseus]|uniref:Uncharacterized protein n=1 Tax=Rhodofomes roseus TaxID=34475 RepID=A0A4Y9YE65_9APHY|nr:hypothetical protein EVJ58_g5590 [Rhodofomes roseus]